MQRGHEPPEPGQLGRCQAARRGVVEGGALAHRPAQGDAGGPAGESRALGLQARTLEVLDVIGAVEPILRRGRVLTAMNAYAGRRRIARVRWTLDDGDTPHPFELVLGQHETTEVLLGRLAELGGRVDFGTELVGLHRGDDGVEAYLRSGEDTERVRAAWVVGADGASSMVRRAVDQPFTGDTYGQRLLLADVAIDWDLPDDQGHIFLLPDGPLVTFPYPERGRWRAIDASDQRRDDTARAPAHFAALLHRAGIETRVHDARWASLFRFHRRIVEHTRIGRVLLVGDAAHVHSPATAQGLNTGVQDAFNLGWKLALVARGEAPDALLGTYEAERLPVAHDVLRDSDRMTRAVLVRNPVLRAIRDRAVAALLARPRIETRVARAMSNLDRRYPAPPFVAGGGLVPGQRVPSPDPSHGALLPFLRDPRPTLLLLPGDGDPTEAAAAARDAAATFGAALSVTWVGPGPAQDGVAHLADPDGRLLRRFVGGLPGAVVVRPDGTSPGGRSASPPVPSRTVSAPCSCPATITTASGPGRPGQCARRIE